MMKNSAICLLFLAIFSVSCIHGPATISVTNITLDSSSIELTEGDSFTLTASVSPSNADNKTVLWTSSNASVATVNRGVVQAVAPGSAVITATSDDGGKTATCNVTVVSKVVKVTGVLLSQNSAALSVGERLELDAIIAPWNATNRSVQWQSSNPGVARIAGVKASGGGNSGGGGTKGKADPDVDGEQPETRAGEDVVSTAVIETLAAGTSVITVRTEDGGFIAQCEIVVSVSVTGITLSNSELTIDEGESRVLTANVIPANATDKEVSWSSSDPAVATVEAGRVQGVKSGTAVITATTHQGGFTASCTVTVITHAQSVSLDKTTLTLERGSSETLTATIHPANTSNSAVRWSSSNPEVATVSEGVVTGKSAGSATISVTTEDGAKTATCNVSVIVSITGLTLEPETLSMKAGENQTLKLTITPSDATEKEITWSSSDPSVATVRDGVVSALGSGTATITAKSVKGVTATCVVSVVVPVSGITVSPQSMTLDRNKSAKLTATISPQNATEKGVTWSSSDPSVATVSSDGEVTAKAIGSAQIIATTVDGGKTAICEVSVIVSIAELSLEPAELSLKKGEDKSLTLTILPADATEKEITWSSSDASVATVKDGVVSALKGGKTTVTAKAANGVSASCAVTVLVPATGITVSPTTLTLEEKTSGKVTASIQPGDATDKTVVWSSSNPSVATVSNGTVQALTPGTADIIAATQDGAFSAVCALTVEKEKPKATSLSFAGDALFVSADNSYTLAVSVKPEDARCDFTWSSSNTSAVSVSGNGDKASVSSNYTSTGYTTVKVTDRRSGLSASIKVYSYLSSFSWNESTGETYSGYPLITLPPGGTHQLQYTSSAGSNVLNLFGDKNNFVFYEPNVVGTPANITLSPDGLVTGVKAGTTGIKPTGAVPGGGKRVYFKVATSVYESEYNDTKDYANPVPYGMPMRFYLSNTSDVDWFKLLVNSGTSGQMSVTISVEFTGASGLGDNEGRLCKYSLYDSSMQLWGSGSFTFSKSAPIASTTRTVPAGPLYLKVYFESSAYSGLLPTSEMIIRMTVN